MHNSTILIIDDNLEILELLQEILGKEYRVIQAENAAQALEILADTSIQLIISDVMMPGIDGFALCERLKTDPEHCHVPLVLLTAKNTLASRIEGLESGADAYIDKPFSPRHLKVQVANLIANRNKIKEYFANSPLVHLKDMADNKEDELFIERLNDIIMQSLDNIQLGGDFLSDALNMSRSTLYRRIKAISNLSVHELISLARLKKSAELLATGKYKVFEVSDMMGFSSPNHFNRIFFKQFGMSPTSFIKRSASGMDEVKAGTNFYFKQSIGRK